MLCRTSGMERTTIAVCVVGVVILHAPPSEPARDWRRVASMTCCNCVVIVCHLINAKASLLSLSSIVQTTPRLHTAPKTSPTASTMATSTSPVPAKALKEWHTPESRTEVIHELIHGVGASPLCPFSPLSLPLLGHAIIELTTSLQTGITLPTLASWRSTSSRRLPTASTTSSPTLLSLSCAYCKAVTMRLPIIIAAAAAAVTNLLF